jgi:phosphoglycolate phosphatase
MKYPVLIFDWDGTLMDSIDKIVACVQQAAKYNDLIIPSAQSVRNVIGLSLDKAMSTLYPTLSKAIQKKMIAAYRDHYSHLNKQKTDFYPGVLEWLKALKSQGYKLAIATGKGRGGLDKLIEQYALQDLFSATICSTEANSKPHPLMLNKLLQLMEVNPQQALMIGDSSYDLEMANNANVACIGVSYGVHDRNTLAQYKPIAIVDDLPSQLTQYI